MELVGKNINILIPETCASKNKLYQQHTQETGENKFIGVYRKLMARKKDGMEFPAEVAVTKMTDSGNSIFTVVIRDITEQKKIEENLRESNERLKTSANTDSLTGLANRRNFDLTFQDEINRATRTGLPLSLLLCDLDHFKQYNDTFGHVAGDECLQLIADAMFKHFERGGELPCRYGGEEFAVILPNINTFDVEKISSSLLKRIREMKIPNPESSAGEFVTMSIGYSTYIPHSKAPLSPEVFIENADKGLYAAKSNGRNQAVAGQKTRS
jgi:diguanylate cyclase (GGDEF)-like protein